MLTIGLTGGIASGKSQVSRYFMDLGIDVIDSDKIGRDLFKPHSPHLEKLRNKFSDSIFLTNGDLDRKALGEIVFADKNHLKWLNEFTHPLIHEQMRELLLESKSTYVVLDIPLLIDKNGQIPDYLSQLIDRVLVVNTNRATQIERIIKRDKLSKNQALNIINSQSSAEQRLLLANDVIDNSGTLDDLRNQVNTLHNQYLKLSEFAGNAN